jgi:hypothetical protein
MSVVASDQKLPSACSTLEARVSPKSRGWTCPACQRGLVGDEVLSWLLCPSGRFSIEAVKGYRGRFVSRSGVLQYRWPDGDWGWDGVLGASLCSAGRGEGKSVVSCSPEPSRAGPRLVSPYYHLGRYREWNPVQ